MTKTAEKKIKKVAKAIEWIKISPEAHKALKIASAQKGRTMFEIASEKLMEL
jgi:hypothetical protein